MQNQQRREWVILYRRALLAADPQKTPAEQRAIARKIADTQMALMRAAMR